MNCPKCSFASPEGTAECPSCGVIFAKLRARAEREKTAAVEPPKEQTPAPEPNLWRGRIIALSVVAVWMLALALYYRAALR